MTSCEGRGPAAQTRVWSTKHAPAFVLGWFATEVLMKPVSMTMLASLLLFGCDVSADPAQPPPPPAVTVAKPLSRVVNDWDEFTGRFEAVDEVELRARVSGYLQS